MPTLLDFGNWHILNVMPTLLDFCNWYILHVMHNQLDMVDWYHSDSHAYSRYMYWQLVSF